MRLVMSHGNGVGDGWPPSAGRLVRVLFLLSVPEFCVPPLVLLWPKFGCVSVLFVPYERFRVPGFLSGSDGR